MLSLCTWFCDDKIIKNWKQKKKFSSACDLVEYILNYYKNYFFISPIQFSALNNSVVKHHFLFFSNYVFKIIIFLALVTGLKITIRWFFRNRNEQVKKRNRLQLAIAYNRITYCNVSWKTAVFLVTQLTVTANR